MYESTGPLRILRIILAIRETSAPYNQFSLPLAEEHDISICTYFASAVTPPDTITVFEGDGTLPGFFRALQAALEATDYDIVHAHSPHVALLYLMYTVVARRTLTSRTVLTVHDSYSNYKLRNRLMFVPVFAAFQRIVCCSQASRDSFPASYKRLAGGRLCVVQNGLDIARVRRIAENSGRHTRRTSHFTIVAISRLVSIKDPFAVLTAFRQAADRNSRLIYIGEGPLRTSMINSGREAGLENQIELTGLIPREKVFEYLLNGDLFISTSRGEGLPVSVLEAMACGCPVLLSDIPPHREIAEGVDFIPLVPVDDEAGFAREIEHFREMPASERAEIGQKCRELVERRFSLSAMHTGYARVYAQLMGRQAPSLMAEIR